MRKLHYGFNLLAIIGLLVFFNSCSDSEDEVDPCENGPVASITNLNNSVEGQDNGSFTVDVTGGTAPFTYSIDGMTFQSGSTITGLAPGNYTATFNAKELSSGIYLYRMTAGNYTETKKLMLLK